MSHELAERDNLETLARVYSDSYEKIVRAYTLLDEAKHDMKQTFLDEFFTVIPRNYYGDPLDAIKIIEREWKQRAWQKIFDRSGMRKILSIKRREELDKQINDQPQTLPDVTATNILALIQDGMSKATDYAAEAVYEVFDWLRPHHERYKTNRRWLVGKKVILEYSVEQSYRKNFFHVRYGREKELTALDNVFHMLDGRGPLKGYKGPLIDAIGLAEGGTGETDFFKFKCYKNHNLHLEFKRHDLVDRLNYTAGNRSEIGAA